MFDYSRTAPSSTTAYTDLDLLAERRPAVMGQVFGLLGFAFIFTAAGAFIAPRIGPSAFLLSLVGTFGTLIALFFLKDRSPINLGLLYGFSTFMGMTLGLVLETYLARGLGGVIFNAAATTASITIVAGAYGATTKRDLSGMGTYLFVGLIGVIVASLGGMFLNLPWLYTGISAVSAVLFTGFIVYDLNRVANTRRATEGEAIMLAVGVYLSIFNLFMALLRLFGFFGSDE